MTDLTPWEDLDEKVQGAIKTLMIASLLLGLAVGLILGWVVVLP